MAIPLRELEAEESNMYELTSAAIRRAYQITKVGDLNEGEKPVPKSIQEILLRTVQYRIEET